jgi:hypothetical protein
MINCVASTFHRGQPHEKATQMQRAFLFQAGGLKFVTEDQAGKNLPRVPGGGDPKFLRSIDAERELSAGKLQILVEEGFYLTS